MVETTNNIIYWLGYGVLASVLVLAIYVVGMVIVKQLSQHTDVFWRHYNNGIHKHLNELTDEEFEEDIGKLREFRRGE